MKVPQATVLLFILCYKTAWDTGVVCWDSQSGHSSFLLYSKLNSAKTVSTAITHTKAYGNRLISPFSHLLFGAEEGFPSCSQGELLPGQTAALRALHLCALLAWFSHNCFPPKLQWFSFCFRLSIREPMPEAQVSLSFSECCKSSVPVLHFTLGEMILKLFPVWRKSFHLWRRVALPC